MILTIILLILTLAVTGVAIWLSVSTDPDLADAPKKPVWIGAGVLLILTILTTGFRIIPAGHVGVVSSFGAIDDDELPPGPAFVIPIVNSITEVDTRVRALRVDGYTAASREQQDLFMNLTLNYAVDPDAASDILQEIGANFQDVVVSPRLQDIPKSVTDDYGTAQVLNARDEIRQISEDLLAAELEPFGFIIIGINLENFGYSPEYNAAIEERQIAEQRVETRQQELEQARVQAEQARVVAEGKAQAAIAEAEGEAESNRLLTESITEELIRYIGITQLQDNINIALVPSDGGLILDVGGLNPEPSPSPEE
jgi:prohibitin 2